ncbi:alpha/beta fold hydrolase [Phenylobacterium sp.]|uniref:alpha/beta fold hydrolase n=1 Tax=Phenylobacterium sp. TaxID=1871053 RepID=UPI00374D5813
MPRSSHLGLLDAGVPARPATGSRPVLSRRYVGAPGHQVHLLEGGGERQGPPLYCLHATAYSGRSFSPLLEALAARRRVAAIDAPGYGASDPPPEPITVTGYAHAIDAALDAAGEAEVDLFGYHTGALIAAELARLRPDRVRRVVLIGVPYFEGAERAAWRKRLAHPMRLTESFSQFAEKWAYFVDDRPPGISLARGFDNFVDELRAYPDGWWAHEAAFTFDAVNGLAQVRQPVLVLNPNSHLAAASRRAAAALPRGELIELPHLVNGIFDVAATELAEAMDKFLTEGRD